MKFIGYIEPFQNAFIFHPSGFQTLTAKCAVETTYDYIYKSKQILSR